MDKLVCGQCNEKGIKLWRNTHCYCGDLKIRCLECMGFLEITREDGKIRKDFGGIEIYTDQIAGKVPCIPMTNNSGEIDGIWGYTSVPQHLVEEWKNLPNCHYIDKLNYKMANLQI
tara:strand:+ start:5847 stop:6194 length:348 start_codon:yes stop_codon:yes gene_type:complete